MSSSATSSSLRVPTICCKEDHKFRPTSISCYVHPANECMIKSDQAYYLHKNGTFSVLKSCFECRDKDSTAVTIYTDQVNPRNKATVTCHINDFTANVNDFTPREPLLKCLNCGAYVHAFCVAPIIPQEYLCNKCSGKKLPLELYSSKWLYSCPLSCWIQDALDRFRTSEKQKDPSVEFPPVTVKVISSTERSFAVKPKMSAVYGGLFPSSFTYRKKAIFAFQEQDGCEVCFFGLYVDEYDDKCATWTDPILPTYNPNARCINISYLDTVHYFQPSKLRRGLYYEIIVSYLNFVSLCGYEKVSIWACPPSNDDDYIFYAHPYDQYRRYPKAKKLRRWYTNLLDVAMERKIVHSYTDLAHEAVINGKSIHQFTYFEDDFWPKFIEETIESLLDELTESDGSLSVSNRSKFNDLLHAKAWSELQKNKNSFFFVELQKDLDKSYPIFDLCATLPSPLFLSRYQFLTFCRNDIRCEFSDIRRAKYSTQRMLEQLVNSQKTATLTAFKDLSHSLLCNPPCDIEGCAKNKAMIQFSTKLPHAHPVRKIFKRYLRSSQNSDEIRPNVLVRIIQNIADLHVFLCSQCKECKSLCGEKNENEQQQLVAPGQPEEKSKEDEEKISSVAQSPSTSGIPYEPSPEGLRF